MITPGNCPMCRAPMRAFGETWASNGVVVCSERCAVDLAAWRARLPVQRLYPWMDHIAQNIVAAALEEMRVRHALVRATQHPMCLTCGGLLLRSWKCETPDCRGAAPPPGMAHAMNGPDGTHNGPGPMTCPNASHHQPCPCGG